MSERASDAANLLPRQFHVEVALASWRNSSHYGYCAFVIIWQVNYDKVVIEQRISASFSSPRSPTSAQISPLETLELRSGKLLGERVSKLADRQTNKHTQVTGSWRGDLFNMNIR